MKERIEREVGVSDGSRAMDTVDGERKLYQPHFPERAGGRDLLGIHVVKVEGKKGWVLNVTNSLKRKAYAISECEFLSNSSRGIFTTFPRHSGHIELCKLLRRKGIRGTYLNGLERFEETGEMPRRSTNIIEFECYPLDEYVRDWSIEPLAEPAEENVE